MKKGALKKRKYIRINSVLPVEFYLIDESGKRLTPYLQGFTHNIGKGGIYLEVNDLWWGFGDRLNEEAKVVLNIESPFNKDTEVNYGNIVWKDVVEKRAFMQYRLGVEFERKHLSSARRLFLYALMKRVTPYLIGIFVIVLSSVAFSAWLLQERLKKENQRLLESYHNSLYKSEALNRNIKREKDFEKFLLQRKKQITARSEKLQKELSLWKKKYASSLEKGEAAKTSSTQLKDTIQQLQGEMRFLEAENAQLKQRILQSKNAAFILTSTLQNTNRSISKINPRIIEGMYAWIKNRQDLRSGLVLSYEGDQDLRRVAFSYDEALAAIVFIIFGDSQRARKTLDFYTKKIENKEPIYNAYYTNGEVYEYVISSGVNAWVGLAALYYIKVTGDRRYMPLAKHVSGMLFDMMDNEGGIRWKPGVKWYSTEHNLDGYAFFRLFYDISGRREYLNAAQEIKKWLNRYAYTDISVPVNRGKGDATIATDTYAWSITALGPETLSLLGVNADDIIDFSVKNCEVNVLFKRKDGTVEVKGFDFAKARNLARGGIISCEWTAQMILAFEVMADYYHGKDAAKSRIYLGKALFYMRELGKMIINSPSPAGKADPTLPYASEADIDTGHGWRTPKGNRVGSLSATAYFLIAYKGVNPLRGAALEVSLGNSYGRSSFSSAKNN